MFAAMNGKNKCSLSEHEKYWPELWMHLAAAMRSVQIYI